MSVCISRSGEYGDHAGLDPENFYCCSRCGAFVEEMAVAAAMSAAAGEQGEFEVPTEFVLALAPFEGADLKEVTARFRYRIRSGQLALSYALVRPDDVIREAYLEHVSAVEDAIGVPIFQGRPE